MTLLRETIPFTDEPTWLAERARDITSTDCAALFDMSPYCTRFELWHRKQTGEYSTIGENERMTWGKRLQDAIADGIAQDNLWTLRRMDEYVRLPESRIGSSFDYADDAAANGVGLIEWQKGGEVAPTFLIETKNVDSLEFRNGWLETDFGLEAPAHIELQVAHQLLVSGLQRAYIAALVGGNRVVLLERKADDVIAQRILDEAAKFWREGEPEPTFPRDAGFIAKLYGYSTADKVIDADEEVASLFREYAGFRSIAKSASDNMDSVHAKILLRIGDAEKVLHPEFSLSAKMIKPTVIETHERKGYRNFKLYERKAK